jgi:hypothetical protein
LGIIGLLGWEGELNSPLFFDLLLYIVVTKKQKVMIEFRIKIRTRKDKWGNELPCDSNELTEVIGKIKEIAKDKIDNTATDEGTCVLGAGIKFQFLKSKERTARSYSMFRAPFQGNVGSYKALKPVLEFLKTEYPQFNFYWDDGVMD